MFSGRYIIAYKEYRKQLRKFKTGLNRLEGPNTFGIYAKSEI